MNNFGIFISSSNASKDVLQFTIPNFYKFANELKLELIIGINTKFSIPNYSSITYCYSQNLNNWSNELLIQLNKLPNKIKFIFLMLDDFYILNHKTNFKKISNLMDIFVKDECEKILLNPIEESFIRNIYYKTLSNHKTIRSVRYNHPYYNSLKIALWNVSTLKNLLSLNQSTIWDFEKINNVGKYYHSTNKTIYYFHLKEKGLFRNELRGHLNLNFKNIPKNKINDKSFISYIFRMIKFKIFGYSLLNLKKLLSNL